jgi:hypothetical protein
MYETASKYKTIVVNMMENNIRSCSFEAKSMAYNPSWPYWTLSYANYTYTRTGEDFSEWPKQGHNIQEMAFQNSGIFISQVQ